ncbi:MAG: hypothetical protein ABSF81_17515 [Bacteroidales bacterium]|jgi:hypothetical protein
MIQSLTAEQRIKEIEEECILELIDRGEQVIDPDKLKQMIEDRVNKITMLYDYFFVCEFYRQIKNLPFLIGF